MAESNPQLLIVEDDAGLAELLPGLLREAGYGCTAVGSGQACLTWCMEHEADLMLLDYSLPDTSATDLLTGLDRVHRLPPFIVITGHGDEELAVALMKRGALDYVVKDGRMLQRLPGVVARSLAEVATRRKLTEAERALQSSEERYRVLVENAAEAIVVTQNGCVQFANAQAERLCGCSAGEVLGRPFVELLHPEDRERVLGYHRQRLAGQPAPAEYEFRLQRKDGQARWVHIRNTSVMWNGTPASLAFFSDVTQRRRQEAVKSARLRLLDRAQTQSLGEVLRATLDEAEAMTGSTIGFFHFLEPDQVRVSLQAWSTNTVERLCTAQPDALHYPVDQAGVWVDCIKERRPVVHNHLDALPHRKGMPPGHAQVMRELTVPVIRAGRITALLGVGNKPTEYTDDDVGDVVALADLAWDLAERKRAEEELRISEKRFRDITYTIADWVWEMDAGCRFTFISDTVESVLGFEAPSILGRTLFELMPEDEAERHRAQFDKLRQSLEPFFALPSTMIHRDGTVRFLETSGIAITDDHGALRGFRGCSRDVTERQRLEKQFLRAQRLDSLGSLASGIAHDLNNILAPILMSLDLLREVVRSAEDRETLELLRASAQRGAGIVRQLLAFARGSETQRTHVNCRYVLREIAKLVEETFPNIVRLHTSVPEDLWSVRADSTQLHQVLLNLCVNARDAMSQGGILTLAAANIEIDEAYVRMNPEARLGAFVRLTVEDTGVGIPPQLMDKVFEPFFSTKPAGQGTGLGLSTVLSITRNHEGFLELQSQPGVGTQFRVYLPAILGPTESESSSPAAVAPGGRGECLLVAEDEAAVREIAVSALQQRGFRVLAASDGAEALAVFMQHEKEIDAAMIDMMMPVMDGATTIVALRRLRPTMPIIAVSGLPDQESPARRAGDAHLTFLLKPFTVDQLLNTLLPLLRANSKPTLPVP